MQHTKLWQQWWLILCIVNVKREFGILDSEQKIDSPMKMIQFCNTLGKGMCFLFLYKLNYLGEERINVMTHCPHNH